MSGKRTTHGSSMRRGSVSASTDSPAGSGPSGSIGIPKESSVSFVPRFQNQEQALTRVSSTAEPEPRRSVRATKGQHTKAFDQLENGPEPPKRRQSNKKGAKKAAEKESKQEEEDEEIIRCICGATTQDDDDENEPWIACDKCGAWQHNVCMGMSVFTEDLTKDYFCEQCAPGDHKQTLDAIKKGEKPWEDRRRKHEEEKKRKKGGKKGKGKRVSDPKDRASPSAAANTKAKPSPTPETKKEENTQETPAAKGKRKPRDHSQGPHSKLRKVSDTVATPTAPVYPKYNPPDDLVDSIQKLEGPRKTAAVAFQKSLDSAVDQSEKKKLYTLPQGTTKKALTERLAIELERAFHDTHPGTSQHQAQLRALVFCLKNNNELATSVINQALPPPAFVVLTGDELATKELQRENAEMKARAEKQSILITEDGPRVRRTHKGEEVVEGDSFVAPDEIPSNIRRVREPDDKDGVKMEPPTPKESEPPSKLAGRPSSSTPLHINTQTSQQSPKSSDFDIGKVFSSVKSPSASHQRRASTQVRSSGPGVDPDVDRLLEDDGNDSPPYSPTEDIDPEVIWRGPLTMTNIADIPATAKYVGGANLSKLRGIPWSDLIPPILTVAGRIPEEKAVPYLCGLRYNNQIDLVITSISPANSGDEAARKQFVGVIDYFLSKKRYGVVGERRLGNVRDTYLIPVPQGEGPIPEPMQNIDDHLIPQKRAEAMLLLVFVVRDEKRSPIPIEQQRLELQQQTPSATPTQAANLPQRHPSISGPTWSPATPQAPFNNGNGPAFPPPQYSQTPVPPPKIPGQPTPVIPPPRPVPPPTTTPVQAPALTAQQEQEINAMRAAQAEGEMLARQVLGPLFNSPTVTFLLPHAARMREGEWNAVRRCLERDSRAREDLQLLSKLLMEEGNNARRPGPSPSTNAASPGVVQTTLEAATANMPQDVVAAAPQAPPQPQAQAQAQPTA